MADPDWDDPCAVAAWLKPQIYKVGLGSVTVSVRHGDEKVDYGPGNYQALIQLYQDAVSECAKKNGSRVGRRRAFVGRILG